MIKFFPLILFTYLFSNNVNNIYNDSWAIIIGINDYKFVDPLNYAVEDAEAISNLLISNFDFKKENIIILTDKEATLDNIRTKLFEVATLVGKDDRLLVYFAGHGETYSLKNGGERGYLIPYDGNLDNIFATCLPMTDIKEISNLTEAKHVLFLMDACYGGLLAVNERSLNRSNPSYIQKITKDNARQIITAGGKGEKVIEKSEWGHSAFAKNILHGLKTGIADEDLDGYITADELGTFLRKRVSIDSDNSQTPVKRRFGSNEGEFVFINNIHIENQTVNLNLDNINTSSTEDLLERLSALEKIVESKEISHNNELSEPKTSSFINNLSVSFNIGYSFNKPEELNQYIQNKMWLYNNQNVNSNQLEDLYLYGLSIEKKYENFSILLGIKKMKYRESNAYIEIDLPNYQFHEQFSNYNYSIYYFNYLYPISNSPIKFSLGGGINLVGASLSYSANIDTLNNQGEFIKLETTEDILFSGTGLGFQLLSHLTLFENSSFRIIFGNSLFFINTTDLIGDISFTSNGIKSDINNFKLFFNDGTNNFNNYIFNYQIIVNYYISQ